MGRFSKDQVLPDITMVTCWLEQLMERCYFVRYYHSKKMMNFEFSVEMIICKENNAGGSKLFTWLIMCNPLSKIMIPVGDGQPIIVLGHFTAGNSIIVHYKLCVYSLSNVQLQDQSAMSHAVDCIFQMSNHTMHMFYHDFIYYIHTHLMVMQ